MWTTLTLAAALSLAPAQGGGLQLTNVRLTVGELGPTRTSNKLIPGDLLFIAFDIEGLSITDDGIAEYTMAMEVTDAADKTIFKQDPRNMADFVPLRGSKVPARGFIVVGLDQEPGTYACKLSVTDKKTKGANSLTTKFEVLKKEFAIVGVFTSYDERGAFSAPTTGVVGQTIFLQFSVASFQRDPKTKQPNVEFEYTVLDEKGQPTLGKPRTLIQDTLLTEDRRVDETTGAFGMRFPLFMSRPGKFSMKVTARDKVANKSFTYELPVTVLPAN
jgi:hypothetical protein